MQDDQDTISGDAARRAVLCGLSIAGVVAAAIIAPRLGWPTGLGVLGAACLVLVVILLAIVPDDVDEGASDPSA